MSILQDIRYGLRMIAKAPGFTVLAMLALALGICANTTIFSFINGVLLRPLTGVKDPDRLVAVFTSDYSSGLYAGSSYPDYVDFRDQTDVFDGLAASEQSIVNATGASEAERLRGTMVTGNYFQVLGISAQLGRTLQQSDDQPSNAQPVVISDALWRRRFSASPAVVGQTLTLNNTPYTIVGVATASFRGLRLGLPPELWLPITATPNLTTSGRADRSIEVIGRLKPDVTIAQAQTQLTTIAARLAQAYPETNLGTLDRPKEPRPVTVAQQSRVNPEAQTGLWRVSILLFAVVGMVLLIACANVANLLLARASVRRREIAVRLALGASRGRLMRQLLTESLLLALLGGVAGLTLTQWTAGTLPRFFPPEDLGAIDLSIDWRVLVFTLGVTLMTGVLFGLVPSLQATRLNLIPSLRDESGSYGQRLRRLALRDVLVISQLALSLVLLICAALFVRSLQHAVRSDPGFAVENLLMASMETRGASFSRQQGQAFYEQAVERAGSLPGVQSATLVAFVPISGGGYRRIVTLEGYQPQPNEDTELNTNIVGPNYFNTIGIPIVAGRDFNAQDRQGAPQVVIVNEVLARRYFGGNALGRRLRLGPEEPFREIVGVARNAKYRNLREEPLPFIYTPLAQDPQSSMTLMVRTAGDPTALVGAVRNEMRALNKDVPLFAVETMKERIGSELAADRMIAVLLSVFGGAALLLATIGIYGVMGYAVAQRTHEIGIRIALGAEQRDILRLIVGQGMILVVIGAGIGLALALAATRLLKSVLFGVSATDPLTFVSVVVVLVGVALLACYLPARRAMKVDPLVALRYE
ncbi:MAG TPA: ABC transporter permease [Pyrinomonadaceae bacterium]|nr:ABC transporter permease [Pyrinomonadaceae bacterium]